MLELMAFFTGYALMSILFLEWKSEQRRRVDASNATNQVIHPARRRSSRASRRFMNSKLLETVNELYSPCSSFEAFTDKFQKLSDLSLAMEKSGLENCEVILGIDFTASNEWQGRQTFNRHCLHTTLQRGALNPYQKVISTLGCVINRFNGSGNIYAYGFGDVNTRNHGVFPFRADFKPCKGFQEVLHRYTMLARTACLAGPTSFGPLIRVAIDRVRENRLFHVLIIVTDGQMGSDQDTVQALVEASEYPLSIILVGVGDGPWQSMEDYDDQLPMRRFDNFQFVDFHRSTSIGSKKNSDTMFALHALMELPDQYSAIQRLKYLTKTTHIK